MVRVVGRPHHVGDADRVAVLDAVVVDDEGRHPVAAEVLARLVLERALRPAPVAPVAIIHLLEEVRHPAGAALDADHLELRELVEETPEDRLADDQRHRGEAGGAEAGEGGLALPRDVADLLALLAAVHEADVHADRDAHLLGLGKERVAVVVEEGLAGGPAGDHHAAQAHLVAALHLGDRRLDAEVRDLPLADEVLRRLADEALAEPIVVALHAGEVELLVLVEHEVTHRALRRVDDLELQAVLLHLLYARRRLEAALVDGVVARAAPAQLVEVLATRFGDETDGHRPAAVVEVPRVAAFLVLHQLRRAFAEAGGQPLLPQIGRFDDVRIGRYDVVLHRGVSFWLTVVSLRNRAGAASSSANVGWSRLEPEPPRTPSSRQD